MPIYALGWVIIVFTGFNLLITGGAYRIKGEKFKVRSLAGLQWGASILVLVGGWGLSSAISLEYISVLAQGKGIFLVGALGHEMYIKLAGSYLAHSPVGLSKLVFYYVLAPIIALGVGELIFQSRNDKDKYLPEDE